MDVKQAAGLRDTPLTRRSHPEKAKGAVTFPKPEAKHTNIFGRNGFICSFSFLPSLCHLSLVFPVLTLERGYPWRSRFLGPPDGLLQSMIHVGHWEACCALRRAGWKVGANGTEQGFGDLSSWQASRNTLPPPSAHQASQRGHLHLGPRSPG